MRSMRDRAGDAQGFTLIELVTVIVIGGILAAVAGPRFFTQTGYSQRGYTEELGAALRLAQKAAVASDCPAQLTLTASTYALAIRSWTRWRLVAMQIWPECRNVPNAPADAAASTRCNKPLNAVISAEEN